MKDTKLLFEAISGSISYNTDIQTSDIDKKFVYAQHPEEVLGFNYVEQMNVDKDTTGYEIRRFLEQLEKGNPNLLELLFTSDNFILHMDPAFKLLIENRDRFLTKKIKNSFLGFAVQNLKKPNVSNIIDNVLNSAYVITEKDSEKIPFLNLLDGGKYALENFGIVKSESKHPYHTKIYNIYFKKTKMYKGFFDSDGKIIESYIPLGEKPLGIIHLSNNRVVIDNDGYLVNGKYIMHSKRLLDMVDEMLNKGEFSVYRENRDELLDIRFGNFHVDKLINQLEKQIKRLDGEFERANLPEVVDKEFLHKILIQIRNNINW